MSISLDLVLLMLYFLFCRKLVRIRKKMNLAPLYTDHAYLLGSCTPLRSDRALLLGPCTANLEVAGKEGKLAGCS